MKYLNICITLGIIVLLCKIPIFASVSGTSSNGKVSTIENSVIEDGITFVPLRFLGEKLGAEIAWDKATQQVTITNDTNVIILTIGLKEATINGKTKLLLKAPKMINGVTMLPLRFVAENLNCQVQYDKDSNIILVKNDDITIKILGRTAGKTTIIKSPKIIDGIPYLTKTQMEQAFNVVIDPENPFQITRQDVHMWLLRKQDIGKTYNRINWRHVPSPSNASVTLVEDGIYYYPVEYLAPYLNATVNYNKTSKELRIIYKGIKIHETVDTRINNVKGYVYLPDGKPAEGFTVKGYYDNWDKVEPLVTTTDNKGYYEFKNIDTQVYPIFGIEVSGENHKNPSYRIYSGKTGGVLISKGQPPLSDFGKAKTYSSLKQMPDIYLIDKSIWDKY